MISERFGEVFGGIETPKSSRRWRISEAYESSSSVASLSIEEGIEDMFVCRITSLLRVSLWRLSSRDLIEIPPNSSFFCTEKRSTIDQTKEFKEIFICAWYCVFFP